MTNAIDPIPLTDADRERIIVRDLMERMQRDLERVMFGGWPPGYEPGKGMPRTLTLASLRGRPEPPPCGCRGVIHTCGFVCC